MDNSIDLFSACIGGGIGMICLASAFMVMRWYVTRIERNNRNAFYQVLGRKKILTKEDL